jgi:ribokinase
MIYNMMVQDFKVWREYMRQARVTVFGSLNYDFAIAGARLPSPGETVKGNRFFMQTGGKGANQALQAARLGAKTTMIGCVGQDFMGDAQIEMLRAEGMDTGYITRLENEKTGVALIFVDQHGQNEIMISANANGACTKEQIDRAQPALCNSDVFLAQFETNFDAVEYALKKARGEGCFVMLDPSPVQPVPKEMWLLVDLVKPNEMEASYYTGLPIDEEDRVGWAREACAKLKALGAPRALITLGDKGCYYSGEKEYFVPPFKINAVDATAAGDSFAGALATAIGEKRAMRDAIVFASAAGALTASKAGAQPSICRRHEVEEFIAYNATMTEMHKGN